ncbi:hypothetical protein PO124_25165 [Bacillus licheniformis]|nr:hypothetical protein [Bacillus licheniformis]
MRSTACVFCLCPIWQPDAAGDSFALGQAFFTLTLGVSVMVTYSSYLSKSQTFRSRRCRS